jgi:hypothetical protein
MALHMQRLGYTQTVLAGEKQRWRFDYDHSSGERSLASG